MKEQAKMTKWTWIAVIVILAELFIIYLLITANNTQAGITPDITLNEFKEHAVVNQEEDWVGAKVSLKEAVHGLNGIKYRYIVKTDCPSWDFETRYMSDKPLDWVDESSSAEVIIYDTQVRYNGTVYASGTYYTVPILGGISSEDISLEAWEENLLNKAYQTYVSTANTSNNIQNLLICLLVGIPGTMFSIYIGTKDRKTKVKKPADTATAVVITYSFDPEVVVVICKDYEAACAYINKDFENEKRIDVEENGWNIDEETTKQEEGYACLGTVYPSGTEPQKTEWRIATKYDKEG